MFIFHILDNFHILEKIIGCISTWISIRFYTMPSLSWKLSISWTVSIYWKIYTSWKFSISWISTQIYTRFITGLPHPENFLILENLYILENILIIWYLHTPPKSQYTSLKKTSRRKQINCQEYNIYSYGLHYHLLISNQMNYYDLHLTFIFWTIDSPLFINIIHVYILSTLWKKKLISINLTPTWNVMSKK